MDQNIKNSLKKTLAWLMTLCVAYNVPVKMDQR